MGTAHIDTAGSLTLDSNCFLSSNDLSFLAVGQEWNGADLNGLAASLRFVACSATFM